LLHTSELAWTEVFAALLAKERAGKIPRELRERAVERFQSLVARGTMVTVPLNRVALNKANGVLQQCHPDIPLRTLDAIHVASADLCQQFPVVTTDKQMRDAAGRLGLPVFPPEPAA
jgi:predicted nucleic acid-binding protein